MKFQQIQNEREPHLKVENNEENVKKFIQANEWYTRKQQDIADNQNRRNENLKYFAEFVHEWQH